MVKIVKKRLATKDFYITILNELKKTTNLSEISKNLCISKQNLNYYLRNLKEKGFVINKGNGWWELTKDGKNPTNYDSLLPKDFIRGHAYVWTITIPKEIEGWKKRTEILKQKGINYILVGALKDTPRIKVLNRKVWLCNNNIRIFDIKDSSYYGKTAIESRTKALNQLFLIIKALENKLGVFLRPLDIEWAKEHYALIKNDLAIDQNRKGIIWRISDEHGEWLLVDDSLEKGGELETIGKGCLNVNLKMQKWWNEQKETNFEVTPKFILEVMNGIQKNQLIFAENMKSHITAIQTLSKEVKGLSKSIRTIKKENQELRLGNQKTLEDY